jgi:hypothetical protein
MLVKFSVGSGSMKNLICTGETTSIRKPRLRVLVPQSIRACAAQIYERKGVLGCDWNGKGGESRGKRAKVTRNKGNEVWGGRA